MARLRATPRPRDFRHPRDPLRLLARERVPAIRRATKEALRHFRSMVPVASLAGAIRRGDKLGAAAAVPVEHFREVLKSVFNVIAALRHDAADLGARKITADFRRAGRRVRFRKAVGDGFDFDRFDQATLQALRDAQDQLIVDMTEQTRDTVAYLIDRGVQAGDSADEIAAAIRDTISLTQRQAQAVANYRALLENLDQGALERQLRNAEYDSAVQDAIDSGEFLSDGAIDRMVEEYADNYLDYRAQTIAQTESIRASNQGLKDSYRQAADRGVFPAEAVTRFWRLGDHPCPICQQILENNRDGVGLDEDFQSDDGPVDDPPIHVSCACDVEFRTNLDMLPDEVGAETEDAIA